jgi:hypothetical protein
LPRRGLLGNWSAQDLMLGRPKRTIEAIEKDMERAIAGAPGFGPQKLLEEYKQARYEQEALGGG